MRGEMGEILFGVPDEPEPNGGVVRGCDVDCATGALYVEGGGATAVAGCAEAEKGVVTAALYTAAVMDGGCIVRGQAMVECLWCFGPSG